MTSKCSSTYFLRLGHHKIIVLQRNSTIKYFLLDFHGISGQINYNLITKKNLFDNIDDVQEKDCTVLNKLNRLADGNNLKHFSYF